MLTVGSYFAPVPPQKWKMHKWSGHIPVTAIHVKFGE